MHAVTLCKILWVLEIFLPQSSLVAVTLSQGGIRLLMHYLVLLCATCGFYHYIIEVMVPLKGGTLEQVRTTDLICPGDGMSFLFSRGYYEYKHSGHTGFVLLPEK